jgi:hypothetical protein
MFCLKEFNFREKLEEKNESNKKYFEFLNKRCKTKKPEGAKCKTHKHISTKFKIYIIGMSMGSTKIEWGVLYYSPLHHLKCFPFPTSESILPSSPRSPQFSRGSINIKKI